MQRARQSPFSVLEPKQSAQVPHHFSQAVSIAGLGLHAHKALNLRQGQLRDGGRGPRVANERQEGSRAAQVRMDGAFGTTTHPLEVSTVTRQFALQASRWPGGWWDQTNQPPQKTPPLPETPPHP